MEGEDLKQALKHDEAIKGSAVMPPDVTQTTVSIVAIGKQLDEKIAMLAKTVALTCVDTARTCVALAMQPADQKVTRGADGQQQIAEQPPRPEVAEKWLRLASTAMDVAHRADSLGDRPLARVELAKG